MIRKVGGRGIPWTVPAPLERPALYGVGGSENGYI